MAHLKNQRILLLRDASRIPRTNFHSQGVRAKVTDLTVDRCFDRFTRNGPALGQIFGDGRELRGSGSHKSDEGAFDADAALRNGDGQVGGGARP